MSRPRDARPVIAAVQNRALPDDFRRWNRSSKIIRNSIENIL
ncbi:hypothetical protein BURPS305_0293 [Burkholderia pseudomallei 305]|nr:hypothetical protein BURPS305_0293 [Burkholderia pseudomallei 305]